MIEVKVRLYGTLRKYHSGKAIGEAAVLPVFESTPLSALLKKINVPAEVVKLIFFNKQQKDVVYLLKDGDQVAVFPPIGGG